MCVSCCVLRLALSYSTLSPQWGIEVETWVRQETLTVYSIVLVLYSTRYCRYCLSYCSVVFHSSCVSVSYVCVNGTTTTIVWEPVVVCSQSRSHVNTCQYRSRAAILSSNIMYTISFNSFIHSFISICILSRRMSNNWLTTAKCKARWSLSIFKNDGIPVWSTNNGSHDGVIICFDNRGHLEY